MAYIYYFLINIEITTYIAFGIARFTIAASFVLVYVYTAELFPTIIRNRAFGATNFCARICTFLCPWIIALSKYIQIDPIGVFASILILASFLSLLLKETLGQEFKEVIYDNNKQNRSYKQFDDQEDNGIISE